MGQNNVDENTAWSHGQRSNTWVNAEGLYGQNDEIPLFKKTQNLAQ